MVNFRPSARCKFRRTDNAGRVGDEEGAVLPAGVVGYKAVAGAGQLQGQSRLFVHILQEVISGSGHFGLTSHVQKNASRLLREETFSKRRDKQVKVIPGFVNISIQNSFRFLQYDTLCQFIYNFYLLKETKLKS